jgi:hypothetical protein
VSSVTEDFPLPILEYTSPFRFRKPPFRFSERKLSETYPINSKFGKESGMLDYKKDKPDAVIDWEKIFNKNVRTQDNQPAGKVVKAHNDENNILITSQSMRHKYEIPKVYVEDIGGTEVSLNLPMAHLDRFLV